MLYRRSSALVASLALAALVGCASEPDGTPSDSGTDAMSVDAAVDAASAIAQSDSGQGSVDAGSVDAAADSGTDGSVVCPALPTTDGLSGGLEGMLAYHNRWRALVGVPAVTWSTTLRAHAQTWADDLAANCTYQHDPNTGGEGENIAAFSSTTAVAASTVVDLWASERSAYDYGTAVTLGNFQDFGHYTQVVWSATTEIGCAYAIGSCPGYYSQYWVCRYAPAGNYLGQAPYADTIDACVDLDNDDVLQKDDSDDHDRAVN